MPSLHKDGPLCFRLPVEGSLTGTAVAAVSTVSKDSSCTVPDAFLSTIDVGTAWMRSVLVGNVPVWMKVDTRANVTAIPERVYQQVLHYLAETWQS